VSGAPKDKRPRHDKGVAESHDGGKPGSAMERIGRSSHESQQAGMHKGFLRRSRMYSQSTKERSRTTEIQQESTKNRKFPIQSSPSNSMYPRAYH
jgi:hypothetical protein